MGCSSAFCRCVRVHLTCIDLLVTTPIYRQESSRLQGGPTAYLQRVSNYTVGKDASDSVWLRPGPAAPRCLSSRLKGTPSFWLCVVCVCVSRRLVRSVRSVRSVVHVTSLGRAKWMVSIWVWEGG